MAPRVQLLLSIFISGAFGTISAYEGSNGNNHHFQPRIGGLETLHKSNEGDVSSLSLPTQKPMVLVDSQLSPNISRVTSTKPSKVIVIASKRRNRNRHLDKERRHLSWSVLHQHYHYHYHHYHGNNSEENKANHEKSKPKQGHVLPGSRRQGDHSVSKHNGSKINSVNQTFESLKVPLTNNQEGNNSTRIGFMYKNLNDSKRNYGIQTSASSEGSSDEGTYEKSVEYPKKETQNTKSNSTPGRPIRTKRYKPLSESNNFNDSKGTSGIHSTRSGRVPYHESYSAQRKENPVIKEITGSNSVVEGLKRTMNQTSHFGRDLNDSKSHSENITIESGEAAYQGLRSEVGDEYLRKVTDQTKIDSPEGNPVGTKCRKSFFRANFNDSEKHSEVLKRKSLESSSHGSLPTIGNEHPRTISAQIKSNFTEGIVLRSTIHFGSKFNDSERYYRNPMPKSGEVEHQEKRSAMGKELLGKTSDDTGSNPTVEISVRSVRQRSLVRSSFNDSKSQTPESDEASFPGSHTAIGNEYPRKISDQIESYHPKGIGLRTDTMHRIPHFETNFNDSKRHYGTLRPESEEVVHHEKRSAKGKEVHGKTSDQIESKPTVEISVRSVHQRSHVRSSFNDSKSQTPESDEASFHETHTAIGNEYPRKISDQLESYLPKGIGLRTDTMHRIPHFETKFNDSKRHFGTLRPESEEVVHHEKSSSHAKELLGKTSYDTGSNATDRILMKSDPGRSFMKSNFNDSIRHYGTLRPESEEVVHHEKRSAKGKEVHGKTSDQIESKPTVEISVRSVHQRSHVRSSFNDSKSQTPESHEASFHGTHTAIGNEYPRKISDQLESYLPKGIGLRTDTMRKIPNFETNFNDSKRHYETLRPESEEVVHHEKSSSHAKELLGKTSDDTGSNPTVEISIRSVHQRSLVRSSFNDSKSQTPESDEASFHGSHTAIGNEYPRKISDHIESYLPKGIGLRTDTMHHIPHFETNFNDSKRHYGTLRPKAGEVVHHEKRSAKGKELLGKTSDDTGSNSTDRILMKSDPGRSFMKSNFDDSKMHYGTLRPESEEVVHHEKRLAKGKDLLGRTSDDTGSNSTDRILMKSDPGRSFMKSNFNDSRKRGDDQPHESDETSLHDGRSIISKEYSESNATEGKMIRSKRAPPRTMINIRYNDSSSPDAGKDKTEDNVMKRRRSRKQKSRRISESSDESKPGSEESKPQRRIYNKSW